MTKPLSPIRTRCATTNPCIESKIYKINVPRELGTNFELTVHQYGNEYLGPAINPHLGYPHITTDDSWFKVGLTSGEDEDITYKNLSPYLTLGRRYLHNNYLVQLTCIRDCHRKDIQANTFGYIDTSLIPFYINNNGHFIYEYRNKEAWKRDEENPLYLYSIHFIEDLSNLENLDNLNNIAYDNDGSVFRAESFSSTDWYEPRDLGFERITIEEAEEKDSSYGYIPMPDELIATPFDNFKNIVMIVLNDGDMVVDESLGIVSDECFPDFITPYNIGTRKITESIKEKFEDLINDTGISLKIGIMCPHEQVSQGEQFIGKGASITTDYQIVEGSSYVRWNNIGQDSLDNISKGRMDISEFENLPFVQSKYVQRDFELIDMTSRSAYYYNLDLPEIEYDCEEFEDAEDELAFYGYYHYRYYWRYWYNADNLDNMFIVHTFSPESVVEYMEELAEDDTDLLIVCSNFISLPIEGYDRFYTSRVTNYGSGTFTSSGAPGYGLISKTYGLPLRPQLTYTERAYEHPLWIERFMTAMDDTGRTIEALFLSLADKFNQDVVPIARNSEVENAQDNLISESYGRRYLHRIEYSEFGVEPPYQIYHIRGISDCFEDSDRTVYAHQHFNDDGDPYWHFCFNSWWGYSWYWFFVNDVYFDYYRFGWYINRENRSLLSWYDKLYSIINYISQKSEFTKIEVEPILSDGDTELFTGISKNRKFSGTYILKPLKDCIFSEHAPILEGSQVLLGEKVLQYTSPDDYSVQEYISRRYLWISDDFKEFFSEIKAIIDPVKIANSTYGTFGINSILCRDWKGLTYEYRFVEYENYPDLLNQAFFDNMLVENPNISPFTDITDTRLFKEYDGGIQYNDTVNEAIFTLTYTSAANEKKYWESLPKQIRVKLYQ